MNTGTILGGLGLLAAGVGIGWVIPGNTVTAGTSINAVETVFFDVGQPSRGDPHSPCD